MSPARPSIAPLVCAGLLGTVLLGTKLIVALLPTIFEPLQAQATDRLFRFRSASESLAPTYDDTIIQVSIDDSDIAAMQGFYLGREDHARLIRGLARAGVAAQFHDVVFAAPQDETADASLERELDRAGNAYLGLALGLVPGGSNQAPAFAGAAVESILDDQRWRLQVEGAPSALFHATRHFVSFPRVAAAARGHGFLDIVADRDGVYRRAPLVVRDGDGYLPSLPFRVICDYLGVSPQNIVVRPGDSIRLSGARRPGETDTREIEIPIDSAGRMIVNYLGPWGRMTNYPFTTVYEAAGDRFMMLDLKEEIEGKIAIVSWIATGSGDHGPVPTDSNYPLSGIHANVMHSILTGNFLRQVSALEMLIWVELPLLVLVFLAARKFSTIPFVLFVLCLIGLHYAAAAAAFFYANRIVNIPGPVLMLSASLVVVAAYQYHVESQARAVLRSTFDAFFSSAVVDKVMDHPHGLVQNAQKKELTILFSDIKSFTTHTSKMEATHVRKLLNEYFEVMIEIVFRHEGTLDKFIGDGLMVFFGDPQEQPDHAGRCVRAAVEMQVASRELNRRWAGRGDMPLEIRVGINTGEVVVGNMGSERRVSYTVLGEPVNLAQRLESNAPVGGVLISRRTRELLGDDVSVLQREPIRVKGIPDPIEVFEVDIEA